MRILSKEVVFYHREGVGKLERDSMDRGCNFLPTTRGGGCQRNWEQKFLPPAKGGGGAEKLTTCDQRQTPSNLVKTITPLVMFVSLS